MSLIDEPTIPDDLSDLLRRASADLEVAPASLGAVHGRARQRRRRRRTLVGCGAAAIVLVAGLAIAQVPIDDGGQQVVTATDPGTEARASAPQPLLVIGGAPDTVVSSGTMTDMGGTLDELVPNEARTWWSIPETWVPSTGVVLADGRKFGLAQRSSQPDDVRIDEVGPDGATVRSHPLANSVPEGGTSAASVIGAVGGEVVIQRSTETPIGGEAADGSQSFQLASSFSAFDPATGTDRPLFSTEDSSTSSAAGGVLVRAIGTDCTLVVSELDGSGERNLDGGCDRAAGVDTIQGLAFQVALSPDGRYVAVVWSSARPTGPVVNVLAVLDLDTGAVVRSDALGEAAVHGLAWTAERGVTFAYTGDEPAIAPRTGGIVVQGLAWDINGGD